MRIWHLFTHTSGLSYGFHHAHPVDALYRKHGFEWGSPRGLDTAGTIDAVARLPLVFQPGTSFNFSMSTDVLGRLVEVWSGMGFDDFLRTRIFEPLGMDETTFWVDGDDQRLAALYIPFGEGGCAVRWDEGGSRRHPSPRVPLGGGGLVSSAGDYHRFMEMLRRRGSSTASASSGRTVDYMTSNHLPGGVDLEAFGQSTWAETTFDGVGFGLGFSVLMDPAPYRTIGPRAPTAGAAASTVQHRPGRGPDPGLLHAAAAVEHLPDPHPAAAAGAPGDRRLTTRPGLRPQLRCARSSGAAPTR